MSTITTGDAPRTLRSIEACDLRRLMLNLPHITPLAQYVERLRTKHQDWEFQDFDPLDGGVYAELLFMLEKPGPRTSPTGKRIGSGFISRNNDDPNAENTFNFMQQAGIPRSKAVMWNVISGWNATIKFDAAEIRRGVEEIRDLLPLLPKLRTVVLVGGPAKRAHSCCKRYDRTCGSTRRRILGRSATGSPREVARYPGSMA